MQLSWTSGRLASSFYEVLKLHNLYFCFVLWVVVTLSCSTVKTIKGGAGLNEMQKWDSSTCVFALVQHLSGRLICIDYGVVRGWAKTCIHLEKHVCVNIKIIHCQSHEFFDNKVSRFLRFPAEGPNSKGTVALNPSLFHLWRCQPTGQVVFPEKDCASVVILETPLTPNMIRAPSWNNEERIE